MKFLSILEQALEKTSLKRVRMKTDPRDRANPFSSAPYEGYIIEENEGVLKIMMISPDMEQDMIEAEPCDVEPVSTSQTFEDFKNFVLNYLQSSGKFDHAEATHHKILHAGDIQHLEAFMKEQGVERDEFEKISKLFLMS